MSKDSEQKPSKPICYFAFKSENGYGDPARIRVLVYNDGISIIEHIVFTDQEGFSDFTLITERFGKKLYARKFSLKYSTLNTIYQNVNKALLKAKVPLKDIL